jgi:hypothetical protein
LTLSNSLIRHFRWLTLSVALNVAVRWLARVGGPSGKRD